VYQLVEPIDKEYVKKRKSLGLYPDSDGNLWKASYGADFISSNKNNMGIENITLTETYTPIYDLKTNDENLEAAKEQLSQFIKDFNQKTGFAQLFHCT
jgi:hypothetical protein